MGTQDRHQEDGDSKVTDLTPSGRGSVSSTWKFPALVANSEVTWGSHPAPPVHPCAHPHLPGTSTRGPGGLCTTEQWALTRPRQMRGLLTLQHMLTGPPLSASAVLGAGGRGSSHSQDPRPGLAEPTC